MFWSVSLYDNLRTFVEVNHHRFAHFSLLITQIAVVIVLQGITKHIE